MTKSLGPYELIRLLGKGGMGEVHLARDTERGREVALKFLPAEQAADSECRARFLREARAAAALDHPNITSIHAVGEIDGRHFIAQEFVDGQLLSDLLSERRLSLAELFDLAVALAEALTYAHEHGVIHRDLKPSNVIVTPAGVPKLLDFGLAKIIQSDQSGYHGEPVTSITVSGEVFGTPTAMSPEQALGQTVDARSDVFAFGSLLYEMSSGRPAFLGKSMMTTMNKVIRAHHKSLKKARSDLPTKFINIIDKALQKSPDERYQRMTDMAADLRNVDRGSSTDIAPPVVEVRPSRAGLVIGLLVVVMAATYGALQLTSSEVTAEADSGESGE